MTKAKRSLWRITNRSLARELLRRLWRIYDSGGVSMGRSLRSCLLESFLFRMPSPRTPEKIREVWSGWEVIEEAKRREEKGIIKGKLRLRSVANLFPAQLLIVSEDQFVCLVLRAMAKWYSDDARIHPGQELLTEQKCVDSALWLLSADKLLADLDQAKISFTAEQLIEEGRVRSRAAHHYELVKRGEFFE